MSEHQAVTKKFSRYGGNLLKIALFGTLWLAIASANAQYILFVNNTPSWHTFQTCFLNYGVAWTPSAPVTVPPGGTGRSVNVSGLKLIMVDGAKIYANGSYISGTFTTSDEQGNEVTFSPDPYWGLGSINAYNMGSTNLGSYLYCGGYGSFILGGVQQGSPPPTACSQHNNAASTSTALNSAHLTIGLGTSTNSLLGKGNITWEAQTMTSTVSRQNFLINNTNAAYNFMFEQKLDVNGNLLQARSGEILAILTATSTQCVQVALYKAQDRGTSNRLSLGWNHHSRRHRLLR